MFKPQDIPSKRAAITVSAIGVMAIAASILTGCGKSETSAEQGPTTISTGMQSDGSVVRGIAVYTITNNQQTALMKVFNLALPTAYAATGTTTVTYVNAASVSFTLNVASFTPNGFTGNTLSLGHVDIASLNDNSLKVCGTAGKTKCTTAIIRVYTIGTIQGFVNTDDGTYGAPVYAGSLNPSTQVGLTSANSVQVEAVSLANTKNKLTLVDFPTPQYTVTSDFSNAGAGSYSMTFVVEYVLQ